jgi:hypothetical protein
MEKVRDILDAAQDFIPDQVPMYVRYATGPVDPRCQNSPWNVHGMYPYMVPMQDLWLYMLTGVCVLMDKENTDKAMEEALKDLADMLRSILSGYIQQAGPCVYIPEDETVLPTLRKYNEEEVILLENNTGVEEFRTKVLTPLISLFESM